MTMAVIFRVVVNGDLSQIAFMLYIAVSLFLVNSRVLALIDSSRPVLELVRPPRRLDLDA